MSTKKVLVTGGAGFIGSHVSERLAMQGMEVVILDNLSAGNKLTPFTKKKSTLIEGDIRDAALVNKAAIGCDYIVHLAAVVGVDQVIKRSREMIEVETMGSFNIANAAIQQGVKKVLYTSSSAVYHKLYADKSSEEDELGLINTYAVAKRLNEKYFESLAEHENISTNSVRLFNVYGPRQDSRMVIPLFFEQALAGKPIEVFGCGNQTRDFTYINEVINGVNDLLIDTSCNGIFNISRGIETTIGQLAVAIKQITRSSSEIIRSEFPVDRLSFKVQRRIGDPEKLFQQTGRKPGINMIQGLTTLFADMNHAKTAENLHQTAGQRVA